MPARRRQPKFVSFISTGAILGFVLGSAAAYFGHDAPRYSEGTAVGFLGLAGACVFALLGAVVAVLLDRRA